MLSHCISMKTWTTLSVLELIHHSLIQNSSTDEEYIEMSATYLTCSDFSPSIIWAREKAADYHHFSPNKFLFKLRRLGYQNNVKSLYQHENVNHIIGSRTDHSIINPKFWLWQGIPWNVSIILNLFWFQFNY